MDIRKISVGPDYKSGAMHYIVGQEILGGSHKIHLIKHNQEKNSILIWIENKKRYTCGKSLTLQCQFQLNIILIFNSEVSILFYSKTH
jgi:hypothetical protein